MDLWSQLGFKTQMQKHFSHDERAQFELARVVAEHKNSFEVIVANEKLNRLSDPLAAKLSGKFSFQASARIDLPAVGDFVFLKKTAGDALSNDWRLIEKLVPRRTSLIRKAPGASTQVQIIGSNIDTVFVVTSMNEEFNERRLERYLTLVWNSGAVPVLLLTKSDLSEDSEEYIAAAEQVTAGSVAVHGLSVQTRLDLNV